MADWFWQGLLTNWLSALITLGVGLMLAYFKKKGSRWVTPILLGLFGMALICIILWAFMAITKLQQEPEPITQENIERNIRTWLDNFAFSTRKEDDPQAFFRLIATTQTNRPITITRLKSLDRYVIVATALTLSPQHKAVFDKLSQEDKGLLLLGIRGEMAKLKIGYVIDNTSNISLLRRLPITSGLTEGNLMTTIDEVDGAFVIAEQFLIMNLNQPSKQISVK